MSRIGKQPVDISGAKVKVDKGVIYIEGPKGKNSLNIPAQVKVQVVDGKVLVTRDNDEKLTRSLHGTIRAIINTMVLGVKDGYKKELDIVGVGYKALLKGKSLILNVGFSHQVEIPVWADLKVTVPTPTHVIIEGVDKQRVGMFSADLRRICPPEPYKGKGIRYTGEEVRKKLGKALAKQ